MVPHGAVRAQYIDDPPTKSMIQSKLRERRPGLWLLLSIRGFKWPVYFIDLMLTKSLTSPLSPSTRELEQGSLPQLTKCNKCPLK